MSRATKRLQREGVAAFDACDVRVPRIQDSLYPPGTPLIEDDLVMPEDPADIAKIYLETDDSPQGWYGGSMAILDCPYTQDNRVEIYSDHNNHNGQHRAYESLRENAGILACRTCEYSGMTPVQVSITRKEFAIAERERLEEYHALEQAREMIAGIDPMA